MKKVNNKRYNIEKKKKLLFKSYYNGLRYGLQSNNEYFLEKLRNYSCTK